MGLGRSFRRNAAKLAYEKFGKAWRAEQRYQAAVVARGGTLPEGTPKLRRKPTFSQWLEITRTAEAQRKAEPIEVQSFVQETDLSWDDDEGEKSDQNS